MAEDKITNLQRRLDEKLINPNDLTQGQRNALDEGFEKGVLFEKKNLFKQHRRHH